MVRRQKKLEIANFTLTLGNSKVLLDVTEDLVIPAFMSNFVKSYRSSSFFFSDVNIAIIGEVEDIPVLGIYGKFIKDVELRREQIYDRESEELVSDPQTLQSSPSSFFVLILNNHRLLFLKETSFAPTIQNFESTYKDFLFRTYHHLFERLTNQGLRVEEIEREYPSPELRITPLANAASLSEFLALYRKLKSLEIKLYRTNNNLNNNALFDGMEESRSAINSSVTTFRHQNETDGLNVEEALQELREIVGQANSRVKFRGIDHEGNKLIGTANNFKVEVPVENLPEGEENKAKTLFSNYNRLISQGIVAAENLTDSVTERILELKNRFTNSSSQ